MTNVNYFFAKKVDLLKYGCGGNCDWLINEGDVCTFWFMSRNVCGFNWEWKHGFRKIVGIILLFGHYFLC